MIEREQLLDTGGRPLTQSLFLELGYSSYAVYTLKDDDYQYNGKNYPSIKRLYLELNDPTEYDFAKAYLLNWNHWKRLCENKQIRVHIEEWRDELEVKMRSKGVKQAIMSAEQGGFQAAKWLADRGWDTKGAGRPSKASVENEKAFQAKVSEEYGADVVRLFKGK